MGRNARRPPPIVIFHEDALNQLPIGEAKKAFHRLPVNGKLIADKGERADHGFRR